MRFTILYILLTLFSCSSTKNTNENKASSYEVTKISSINNWNIIYATKKDSVYKIVTKKKY